MPWYPRVLRAQLDVLHPDDHPIYGASHDMVFDVKYIACAARWTYYSPSLSPLRFPPRFWFVARGSTVNALTCWRIRISFIYHAYECDMLRFGCGGSHHPFRPPLPLDCPCEHHRGSRLKAACPGISRSLHLPTPTAS